MHRGNKINLSRLNIVILGLILANLAVLFIFLFPQKSPEQVIKNTLTTNPFGMRSMTSGEDLQSYVRSQMSICFKNESDACYLQVADLLFYEIGYQKVLNIFQDAQNYPEIFARCHQVTHYIGRKTYLANPSVRELFEHSNPSCWGGFYHGVIEGYFEKVGYSGTAQFILEIKNVCGKASEYSTPLLYFECLHGIGHAMMFVSSGNLLDALKWCDEMPAGEQWYCHSGVFMENSSSSTNGNHVSKYLKADDPFYPCNVLQERYLKVCYQYQSSYFAKLSNLDYIKNAELCGQVPKAYQEGCFRVIGSNQVGSTKDLHKMNAVCLSMPSSSTQGYCVDGVVGGLVGRYVNDSGAIVKFCKLVDSKTQRQCWVDMGIGIASWSKNADLANLLCSLQDLQFSEWCREGLRSFIENTQFVAN